MGLIRDSVSLLAGKGLSLKELVIFGSDYNFIIDEYSFGFFFFVSYKKIYLYS